VVREIITKGGIMAPLFCAPMLGATEKSQPGVGFCYLISVNVKRMEIDNDVNRRGFYLFWG
jgi:hypothetical protein